MIGRFIMPNMIQVLIRAMRIIELLGSAPQSKFSISDISKRLSLDRGTCTNIMKTLASHGFVQQDAPRDGYKIGYMLYYLTSGVATNEELVKTAREDVEKLGTFLNEAVVLSVIRNDKRIVLYSTTPDRDLLVRTRVDKSVYASNSARVILANYTPDHLDRFIIRRGIPTPKEWPEIYDYNNPAKELRNLFAQIKMSGFSIQVDENDIIGLAAPIFQNGHVVGSVGTYLPLFRLKNREIVLNAVLKTVKRINGKIEQLVAKGCL